MTERLDVLFVGVGGQGVLTTAGVLGDAAMAAGHAAVVGQLHGMSQRGGCVECSVRIGPVHSSYLCGPPGLLVGFDRLETLRALPRIGPETRVVTNAGGIVPCEATRAGGAASTVAGDLAAAREAAAELVVVDAQRLVARTGLGRTLNVIMLGAVAGLGLLPFDGAFLLQAIERRYPARFREANRRAFALGAEGIDTRRCASG